MLSNVIVHIAFPRRSFVSSQSSCEVPASLTDVGGVAVGATDLFKLLPVCSCSSFVFLGSINRSDRHASYTITFHNLIDKTKESRRFTFSC